MTGQAIVTNVDRQWALAKKPEWFRMGDLSEAFGELVDDGVWLDAEPTAGSDDERPSWASFVADEIERFERNYAGEFRSADDWSSIWRKGWWPRVSPKKRFPKSAPKMAHPFFRAGSAEFDAAVKLATPAERMIWLRFGIAQFTPDDPRVSKIAGKPAGLTQKSKAMAGGE